MNEYRRVKSGCVREHEMNIVLKRKMSFWIDVLFIYRYIYCDILKILMCNCYVFLYYGVKGPKGSMNGRVHVVCILGQKYSYVYCWVVRRVLGMLLCVWNRSFEKL